LNRIERGTGLPLDLVVFINSFFLYEKLTDENFDQAIALWFENEEECKWKFGHISDWTTSRVTSMEGAFNNRASFNEDISRWDVSNVMDMSFMFCGAAEFDADLSQWDVGNVTFMAAMFAGAVQFNGNIKQWNVRNVTDLEYLLGSRL
jgi:hypothetical protein